MKGNCALFFYDSHISTRNSSHEGGANVAGRPPVGFAGNVSFFVGAGLRIPTRCSKVVD